MEKRLFQLRFDIKLTYSLLWLKFFMHSFPEIMSFYEAIWHSDSIGDGLDLEEALQSYLNVKPDYNGWDSACKIEGVNS